VPKSDLNDTKLKKPAPAEGSTEFFAAIDEDKENRVAEGETVVDLLSGRV
jgi:hypothetical protein